MSLVGWVAPVITGVVASLGFGTAVSLIGRGSAMAGSRIDQLAVPGRVSADENSSATRLGRGVADALGDRVVAVASLGARGWLAALGAAGVVGLAVGSVGPVILVASGIGLAVAAGHQLLIRRQSAFDAALPDLVDAMAAAVRSGAVPAAALVDASTGAPRVIADDVDRVSQRMGRGERFADAVAWWSSRRCRPGLDLLAAVMATSDEFGGPLATVLDDVANHLRHDIRTRDDVRTHSAQAIASAAMLILLPVVTTVITALADPGVLRVLFATPIGAACLGVGLVLEASAAWWMYLIVRGVQ